MKLINYLDNLKRKGSYIIINDEESYNIFKGTITMFSHWIHNMEYYKREIIRIGFDEDDIMIIELECD